MYDKEDVARFIRYGQVTDNGVVYDEELFSIDGMFFTLLREPHQTDADIDLAKRLIRNDRDVVGMKVVRVPA